MTKRYKFTPAGEIDDIWARRAWLYNAAAQVLHRTAGQNWGVYPLLLIIEWSMTLSLANYDINAWEVWKSGGTFCNGCLFPAHHELRLCLPLFLSIFCDPLCPVQPPSHTPSAKPGGAGQSWTVLDSVMVFIARVHLNSTFIVSIVCPSIFRLSQYP